MKPTALLKNARFKKICLWIAGVIGVYAILGFLVAPPVVKSLLTKRLTEEFGQQVTIRKIRINPFTLTTRVDGFALADKTGQPPLLAFGELYGNLELLSLIRLAPVFKGLHLTRPQIHIVRNEDNSYNFSAILDKLRSEPGGTSTPRFSVNDIRISDGNIEFDDRINRAQHDLADINLTIPFLSNLPRDINTQIQPSFSARIDGKPIELKGRSKPFKQTRRTGIELKLSDLDISRYMEYVPGRLSFKVPSAVFDADLFVGFVHDPKHGAILKVSGTAALKDVSITSVNDAPLVKFSRLDVGIGSLHPFRKSIDIDSIRLTNPEIYVERAKDGSINLASALAMKPAMNAGVNRPAPLQTAPAAKNEKTSGPTFTVGEIRIDNGKIHLSDDSLGSPFHAEIDAFQSTIRDLANTGTKPAAATMSFTTAKGTTFNTSAKLALKPLTLKGTLEFAKLHLKDYAPYYAPSVAAEFDDGSVDLKTGYALNMADGSAHATLSGLAISLSSVVARRTGEKQPFMKIASGKIADASLDLDKHTVTIPEVSLTGGMLSVTRERDGKLSLEQIIRPVAGSHKTEGHENSPPWAVSVGSLKLSDCTAGFRDLTLTKPMTLSLDKLNVDAQNLSTVPGTKGQATLHFAVNGKGSASVNASFTRDPLDVTLKLDAKAIDITPLQPLIAKATNIVVRRGNASIKGRIALTADAHKGLRGTFRGNAGITDFSSIDKVNSRDFLKWKSLALNGIDTTIEPFALTVNSVTLRDFYSRLIVNPSGRLNVQDILNPGNASAKKVAAANEQAAAPAPTAKASRQAPIKVKKVTLRGGNINFSDHYIKPNYSANLTDIKGTITGLSSDPQTRAAVSLAGFVNHDAPIDITGKINPLGSDLYADIKASAKGIELSPLTPYAEKYAGYGIEKGKLSLDIQYHIENQQLTAKNNVFLDQLTFGDKVDSPDAIKAPILLAVALLKNNRGEIDVNLPISGSLDDPQFSIGGIIVKVIVNLIVKAATAPFALLSAAFGSGEELSYVEFDPGKAAPAATATKKLQALAKALNDRPALKLEITGRVDPATDPDGLRHVLLERKVKAEKLKGSGDSGKESIDEVRIDPSEYAKYLKKTYGDADIKKPRNFIGLAKGLPVPKMEKLLLANTKITNDDLRRLANQRALAVKNYLVHQGKVPQQRIFIVAPKLTAAGIKDKGKASRADFSLK